MSSILVPALLALVIAAALTPICIVVAKRLGIVDRPGGRRIHRGRIPRLGGLAIVAAFFAVLLVYLPDIAPHFKSKQLLGFSLAALLLVVAGVIDDKRGLSPALQLGIHVVAALSLVLVGMGVEEVTNPFGGKLALDQWQIAMPVGGVDHFLTLPADLITVIWVVLVINAINWLDGLDGLATGVGAISAAALALLSLSAAVDQPHVALLAMILVGALLGFLPYNFQPAKIFLGTAGSTFIGFAIATLAIISGGKIATAVLVLGFPILDALTLVVRRSMTTGAPWRADTQHLHHQLLAAGLSVRQAVLTVYILSMIFGGLALLAGTTGQKLLAFGLLVVVMAVVLGWVTVSGKRRT